MQSSRQKAQLLKPSNKTASQPERDTASLVESNISVSILAYLKVFLFKTCISSFNYFFSLPGVNRLPYILHSHQS